ncbi:MAG: CopG family transcriptional regulator [Tepidiformaceae bacterium]
MIKTSVYLSPPAAERLAWLSESEGRPRAQIIREAILSYAPGPSAERRFHLAGCFEGDGRSVADIPEEELMEGFGE